MASGTLVDQRCRRPGQSFGRISFASASMFVRLTGPVISSPLSPLRIWSVFDIPAAVVENA